MYPIYQGLTYVMWNGGLTPVSTRQVAMSSKSTGTNWPPLSVERPRIEWSVENELLSLCRKIVNGLSRSRCRHAGQEGWEKILSPHQTCSVDKANSSSVNWAATQCNEMKGELKEGIPGLAEINQKSLRRDQSNERTLDRVITTPSL